MPVCKMRESAGSHPTINTQQHTYITSVVTYSISATESGFFAAVSDGFGSSVHFTYQVAALK